MLLLAFRVQMYIKMPKQRTKCYSNFKIGGNIAVIHNINSPPKVGQGKRIIKELRVSRYFCLTQISQITRKRIVSLAFAIRTATYER